MVEIEYFIDGMKASMFVDGEHSFYLTTQKWVLAESLVAGDKIVACCGTVANIISTRKLAQTHTVRDLKSSHNHNYFVTNSSALSDSSICHSVPVDPLELISYRLADQPSAFPNGKPTGHHSGPWAAARYLEVEFSECAIGWGHATHDMCAEDAAVSDLRRKLGNRVELDRGNVAISHAYLRKYTRQGRLVNKMSPCIQCRKNYGSSLNDETIGESNLPKGGRGFLPLKS